MGTSGVEISVTCSSFVVCSVVHHRLSSLKRESEIEIEIGTTIGRCSVPRVLEIVPGREMIEEKGFSMQHR